MERSIGGANERGGGGRGKVQLKSEGVCAVVDSTMDGVNCMGQVQLLHASQTKQKHKRGPPRGIAK